MVKYLQKSVLSGLFLLIAIVASGQVQESLQNQLRTARYDTTRLRLYCQIADSLYKKDQYDSLYNIIQQGLPLAIRLRSNQQLAWLYYRLGLVYRNKGLFEKSILFMEKTKTIYTRLGDREKLARTLYGLSVVHFDKGDYKTGISISLANLGYFKKHNIIKYENYTFLLLAEMYGNLKNSRMKRFYLDKYFQMARHTDDLGERIEAFDLKAGFYEEQGDYRQAWFYRKQITLLARILRKPIVSVLGLNAAALNLRKQNRLDEALTYLREAMEIGKAAHDRGMQGQTLQEMALNQLQRGHHQEALKLAQQGVTVIQFVNGPKGYADALKNLATVQEATGQYQQALKTYKDYHSVNDSLHSAEKVAKIAQVEARYGLDNKEKAIQLLTRNAQLQQLKARQQEDRLAIARQRQLLLVTGAVMLIILVVIISYFLYRSRKTQKILTRQKLEIESQANQLKESNQMKDKLFSIVSHDLRAPVASLKASFTLRKVGVQEADDWTVMEREVNNLSHTLDNTLYWSLTQRNGIRVSPHLEILADLVHDMLESFTGLIAYKNLTLTFHEIPAKVLMDENLTALVLRNILHNAIKFTPAGGVISLKISETSTATELTVTDTGVGMDLNKVELQHQGPERGTGLGLALSDELMKRNGGQLLIKSQIGQGTSVTLSWPKA
jgi:signal transduction histidine kinase